MCFFSMEDNSLENAIYLSIIIFCTSILLLDFFWHLTKLDLLLLLFIKWKGNSTFLLVNESFAFHISKASKLVCFAAYCAESCKGYMGWGGEQRMGTWGGGGSVNGGSGSGVGEGAQAFTPVVSRTPRNMGLLIWRRIESDNWHDYVKLDISREYLALQLALNLQNSVLIKWPCAAHRAEIYSASNR